MHRLETTDLSHLKDFLQREGQIYERDWLPADINGPAAAALSGDQVVGVARVYRTWLHPQRWRLAIFVSPDWRRRKVGADLLRALVDNLPLRDRQLQSSVFATNTAAIGFLAHAGFESLMTTRLGSLDVSKVPVAWRERCSRDQYLLERHGIRIESLESRSGVLQETALFHEVIYRDQHAWDPPRKLTLEDCIELFMNDAEFDPAMQFLALKGSEINAAASLRYTPTSHRLDLGWIGMVGVPPKHRDALYRALWGRCLDAAVRRNASIDLEIDRVDSYANVIVEELRVHWDAEWLTFCTDQLR